MKRSALLTLVTSLLPLIVTEAVNKAQDFVLFPTAA